MKLMAIDGNSLVNRAFYAVRLLTNRQGLYTNAVYGFVNILLKLLEEEQPDQVCVCFDMRAKTFRHLKYEGYKAQRKGMPDELAQQMPIIKEVLDKMGIEYDPAAKYLGRNGKYIGKPAAAVVNCCPTDTIYDIRE